jgi:hypothetical protein
LIKVEELVEWKRERGDEMDLQHLYQVIEQLIPQLIISAWGFVASGQLSQTLQGEST